MNHSATNHSVIEPSILHELRARRDADGGVFRLGDDEVCIVDPNAAQRFNATNFRRQVLSDRLVDLLRRRTSPEVTWDEVRAAWTGPLKQLAGPHDAQLLAARMDALCVEFTDRRIDLTELAQDVCSRSLVPAVVTVSTVAEESSLVADQRLKIQQLLAPPTHNPSLGERLRSFAVQVRAGLTVRRELRRRQRGQRARQNDLTDPIVDLLPRLGMDRAVDAVTAVLTAIAGPPGSAAACLLYELTRRPGWLRRIGEELDGQSASQLAASPAHSPQTHRFVKECLRMWSLPLLMVRPVHEDMHIEDEHMKPGDRVILSSYLMHHDPQLWRDPDVFDPDRWLRAGGCPHHSEPYAPFGWAPRSCLGARLGLLQLVLFCQLVTCRYRLELEDPENLRVELATVPRVLDFYGTLQRR